MPMTSPVQNIETAKALHHNAGTCSFKQFNSEIRSASRSTKCLPGLPPESLARQGFPAVSFCWFWGPFYQKELLTFFFKESRQLGKVLYEIQENFAEISTFLTGRTVAKAGRLW